MKLDENSIFSMEDSSLAKTYMKRRVILTRGKGSHVWDIDGKEYIDCTTGYGVALAGHCHPKIIGAIKEQLNLLTVCHGSFYNDTRAQFLDRLIKITPKGLNRVFLGNSGAEAVECAIKVARKYTKKTDIIAMMKSYHGKTFGSLSATWNAKYRAPFEPLVPGFTFVPYGKIDRVREIISEKTAAIIAEPIQGEGGINVPPEDFFPELRELCDERGLILIADEVQTGFGRTGKLWACEHWNTIPDIMTLSKPMGGGIPMSVTVARDEVMSSLAMGEHSSTFGGNPIACAAASAFIDLILEENLVEKAATVGADLKTRLESLKSVHPVIREVRGLGLMLAAEFRFDVLNVLLQTAENGLLILDAGRNVIRLLPPFVMTSEDLTQVISIMDKVLDTGDDITVRT
jgi:LysW-gamma-L-lysine/LysW-L-ornithine aminotransferase